MEIRVKVNPNKKKETVSVLTDGRYSIDVHADRKGGDANKRTIELLAEYFGVEEKQVSLISGHTRSTKCIRVQGFTGTRVQE